jgi:hypothetical protein
MMLVMIILRIFLQLNSLGSPKKASDWESSESLSNENNLLCGSLTQKKIFLFVSIFSMLFQKYLKGFGVICSRSQWLGQSS